MLTVVVAAFNEAEALPLLQPRIAAALDALRRDAGVEGRVLYVDDGSRDGTWTTLRDIASSDRAFLLLRLSRNFGKELALTAGLDRVVEGAALILDADGQDPPELIPRFVANGAKATMTCTARAACARARAGSSAPPRTRSTG